MFDFLLPSKSSDTSLLDRMTPVNLEEEREKFFFDPKYNPQFEYDDDFDPKDVKRYGKVSDEFLPVAEAILKKVTREFGDNEAYAEKTQGRVLSQREVELAIRSYLKENRLDSELSVRFSPQFHSRTSIYKTTLRIRIPVNYREHGLLGVLHHEIGTHFSRRKNGICQPWHLHHEKYHLRPYLETEEGMAVLHSQIPATDRHLWFPALVYYATCMAMRMSFSDLNTDLKKYISDRDRRFKICLKVKRGHRDTSQPGALAKNQVYLQGSIVVARWLYQNRFEVDQLYFGKIAAEDVERAKKISVIPESELSLPTFLLDKKQYIDIIKDIVSTNKIESLMK